MHSGHWFVHEGLQAGMSEYLARAVTAYASHVSQAQTAEIAFKGGRSVEAE